jgi:His-Xaa-Ser system protein HxsD
MVDDTTVVSFNSAIYAHKAIKKAARKFQTQLCVLIEYHGSTNEVRLISNACCKSFDALVRDFCNEVLDQELRDRVVREMAGIRCLLSAQFFSKTSLADCA